MKLTDTRKIMKKMEKALDAKRYEHTLGVAYTASSLAMSNGINFEKAFVAGLLHDCAKCISNEKKLEICNKHNIEISEIERKNLCLLHAKVGSYIAAKQFRISDRDILNAILFHTTGRPGMSQLEKIIYIADYIEPGRKHAPNLPKVRKLAFQDLDEALLKILEDTLGYLGSVGGSIDPMTKRTYDYYEAYMRIEKRQED
ncbi:bis(5'-nucleosyl)-tetraphosphatase (symmetrical) YqeK [Parablautia intestinalis]|jgi:predicted HD superfamily hydrolase involved in NAD metabolism|uniref:bis(5'-nucleosyl)-tetraphosphatase (symmetrical) YqeK n=1 Tax=Parablautia intestinalis TaxID=2320100 RepID=UPI00259D0F3C|nr:bis(5'-nucleosyl)-tetraphosphatase (symmetrical) YqeK [Parablautia intestinalis]MCI8614454.1 HD domain-containing protein [Lachnospiraceae bacterium]